MTPQIGMLTVDLTTDKFGVLLFAAVLAFVATWFWRYRARVEKERDDADERITALEKRIEVVDTKMSPLWAAVQSQIARDLTHPHPQFQEMDNLLRKLGALTITHRERERLLVLLEERINSTDPAVTLEEKESAKLLEGVMAKVIVEREEQGPDPEGAEIIVGLIGMFVATLAYLVG